MKMLCSMICSAAWAAGALAPLSMAEVLPQEMYARLSAPAQPAPADPAKRAARLPALAHVPNAADLVVALREPGEASLEWMRLLGEKPPAELERGLRSIGSAALVAGEGNAAALERLLPLLARTAQLESLSRCEELWCSHAKEMFVPAIRSAFAAQRRDTLQGILRAWAEFRPAPVYYAITARAGHEAGFAAMHAALLRGMQAAAQQDSALGYEEHGRFAGLRMNWLLVCRLLLGAEPQEPELREALAGRDLLVLTRREGAVAWVCVCSAPGELQLPAGPEYSMLTAPQLAGADAHMDELVLTAWASATLCRVLDEGARAARVPAELAVAAALWQIAGRTPTHQAELNAAANGMTWLTQQAPLFNAVDSPQSLQVWRQGREVWMESVSDAQGMLFGPGHLRQVGLAAAPGTVFYMESTSFSAPNVPEPAHYWEQASAALLAAGRGVALTLKENERGRAEAALRYADLLLPEVQQMGSALVTMAAGASSPFALVVAESPGEEAPGVALGVGVTSRGALAQGWETLLQALRSAVAKAGLPPELAEALPISSHRLPGSGVSYTLELPLRPEGGAAPGVAVGPTYAVLGSSPALNARLLASAGGNMPFCGAVNSVDLPRMEEALRGAPLPELCGGLLPLSKLLHYLAEHAQTLYTVSTITDDVRTARGVLLLKEK
ncbi:MAG: hypothetical protein J1E42_06040 [Akkermansiaceae bacterium]|nr:hypothetical protein [Akkermansiaceae bacterium]